MPACKTVALLKKVGGPPEFTWQSLTRPRSPTLSQPRLVTSFVFVTCASFAQLDGDVIGRRIDLGSLTTPLFRQRNAALREATTPHYTVVAESDRRRAAAHDAQVFANRHACASPPIATVRWPAGEDRAIANDDGIVRRLKENRCAAAAGIREGKAVQVNRHSPSGGDANGVLAGRARQVRRQVVRARASDDADGPRVARKRVQIRARLDLLQGLHRRRRCAGRWRSGPAANAEGERRQKANKRGDPFHRRFELFRSQGLGEAGHAMEVVGDCRLRRQQRTKRADAVEALAGCCGGDVA